MRNKHAMLIMTLVCFVASPAGAFGNGYFQDLQCNAEKAQTGECNRLSDGQNNLLTWASIFCGFVTFVTTILGVISLIWRLVFVFDCTNARAWGNSTVGSNEYTCKKSL